MLLATALVIFCVWRPSPVLAATAGSDPMVVVVDTTLSPGTTVALPLRGAVDVTVDWGGPGTGCGTAVVQNAAMTTDLSCTYSTGGVYTIAVTGSFTQFGNSWASYPGADKVVKVTSFGNTGVTSLEGAFAKAVNLVEVPATLPATVTDLSHAFYNATGFNQSLSGWNTTNVTDLSYVLSGARNFNNGCGLRDGFPDPSCPLTWDTANVTDLSGAFVANQSFNQSLASWNTANVTSLRDVFNGAWSYNNGCSYAMLTCPLPWDTANVTDMALMFAGAQQFNQDISNWNTAKVTDMQATFFYNYNFNNGCAAGVSGCPLLWDTAAVVEMRQTFSDTQSFNQDLSAWCVSAFSTAPEEFDLGAAAWTTARPAWGTCPSIPAAPATPTAQPVGSGQMLVSTSPTGKTAVSSYTFTSSPGSLRCTALAPARSCTISGLAGGTQYSFTATAANPRGTSPASTASTKRAAIDMSSLGTAQVVNGTTLSFPTTTVPANARVLIHLAADNTASSKPTVTAVTVGGTALSCTTSSRLQGATATAGTGVSGALAACKASTTVTGTVVATLSAAPAKAVAWGEYIVGVPAANAWTAVTPTGSAANAPSIKPSSPIAAGRLIIGSVAFESGTNLAADTDTAGGRVWTPPTRASTGSVSANADVTVMRQAKFTTASAAQTYDSVTGTPSAADWSAFFISIAL